MALDDPVAIVTGAGNREGIGFAIAGELASSGHRLLITSTTSRIEERAAALRELGATVSTVAADLTDRDAARDLVERAVVEYGRVDVLVNNAGPTSVSNTETQARSTSFPSSDGMQRWLGTSTRCSS